MIEEMIKELWNETYENVANFEDLSDDDIIMLRETIKKRLDRSLDLSNNIADHYRIKVGDDS